MHASRTACLYAFVHYCLSVVHADLARRALKLMHASLSLKNLNSRSTCCGLSLRHRIKVCTTQGLPGHMLHASLRETRLELGHQFALHPLLPCIHGCPQLSATL